MRSLTRPARPIQASHWAKKKIADSDQQILISNIGVLNDWPAAYTPNIGPGDAFMLVQLKGKPGRPGAFDYVDRLREKLNAQFPDIEFAFDTGGMLTSALTWRALANHFQVRGANLQEMREISEHVEDAANSVEGTVDVRIAQRLDLSDHDHHDESWQGGTDGAHARGRDAESRFRNE